MKNKLILIIYLLVSSCMTTSVRTAYPARNVISSVENSVVAFVFRPGDIRGAVPKNSVGEDQTSFCAGTFIRENLIVSAAHCFDDPIPPSIREAIWLQGVMDELLPSLNGRVFKIATRDMTDQFGVIADYRLVEVVNYSYQADLAILRLLPDQPMFPREHLNLPSHGYRNHVGQDVFTIGHPSGILWNFSEGVASSVDVLDQGLADMNRIFIVTSINVYFGNSGGPLFDDHGRFIGVCSAFRGNGNVSYFINTETIRDLVYEYDNNS